MLPALTSSSEIPTSFLITDIADLEQPLRESQNNLHRNAPHFYDILITGEKVRRIIRGVAIDLLPKMMTQRLPARMLAHYENVNMGVGSVDYSSARQLEGFCNTQLSDHLRDVLNRHSQADTDEMREVYRAYLVALGRAAQLLFHQADLIADFPNLVKRWLEDRDQWLELPAEPFSLPARCGGFC